MTFFRTYSEVFRLVKYLIASATCEGLGPAHTLHRSTTHDESVRPKPVAELITEISTLDYKCVERLKSAYWQIESSLSIQIPQVRRYFPTSGIGSSITTALFKGLIS
jgi:hypothetical protein